MFQEDAFQEDAFQMSVNVSAGVDELALTANKANVNAAVNVQADTASFAVSTFGASVKNNAAVNASTVALTLAANSALVNYSINVQAGVCLLSLTTHDAAVNVVIAVTAAVKALALQTFSALVSYDINIQAKVANLSLQTFGAGTYYDVLVHAGCASLVLTKYPADINGQYIEAAFASLALSPYAANINAGINVQATADSLIIRGRRASITLPYTGVIKYGDWRDFKGEGPWNLVKQGNKRGYVNNPNFTDDPSPRDGHRPCGYWVTENIIETKIRTPIKRWFDVNMSDMGDVVTANHYYYDSQDFVYTTAETENGYMKGVATSCVHHFISASNDGKYQLTGEYSATGKIWVSSDYGKTWVESNSPAGYWFKGYVSGNGKYMLATFSNTGACYLSSDYGINWVSTGINTGLPCGISYSGRYMAVSRYLTGTFSLSNDFGATWTIKSGIVGPFTISYGGKIFVGTGGGNSEYLAVSGNYGANWVVKSIPAPGRIAISKDGQHIIASGRHSNIYYSHDYGVTWTTVVKSDTHSSSSEVAISDDGQYMACCSYGLGSTPTASRGLWCSDDGGTTWRNERPGGFLSWESVDMSADGKYWVASAANYPTYLWFSKNYGRSWTPWHGYTFINDFEEPVWPFEEQPNKWGFLNNPRWQTSPQRQVSYTGNESAEPQIWALPGTGYSSGTSKKHIPCGHWHKKMA